MNTDRHTPGPWHIDRDGKHPYIVAGDTQPAWNRPVVCYLYRDVTPENSVTIGAWLRSEENAEANARLIAAAPALLAALRDCVQFLEIAWDRCEGDFLGIHHNAGTDALDNARRVIATIEGC